MRTARAPGRIPEMIRFGIVVHGGVGSPREWDDGCERAAAAGFAVLEKAGSALDAVVEAARVLEDDGRYNAGTGSAIRLDGQTIEMDAGLMTSDGRIGAVAAIRDVRNPILVAREVMDTPHVLLAGEGATQFARRRGFPPSSHPTADRIERVKKIIGFFRDGKRDSLRPPWRNVDLKALWNFPQPYEEVIGCDTIGAVALDRRGGLAVANSTGGAAPMLLGRVGDSPIVGCGFYAGPAAAVATTGIGEEIIRRQLARSVYDAIAGGESVQRACEKGVALFPGEIIVGVIAIAPGGTGVADNRNMARALRVRES